MAPTTHTYLDYYQVKDPTGEPLAIGGFLPLEKVYAFEPIPAELSPEAARHVLGAQAQLWTEYIVHPETRRVHGVSASGGAGRGGLDSGCGEGLRGLSARLATHLQRLVALDVNARRPTP